MRVTPELWKKYKEMRNNNHKALHCYQQAKYACLPRPVYITSLPYSDAPEEVVVPGVGVLRFTVEDDNDHDPFDDDGQAVQWIVADRNHDTKKQYPVGARVQDNVYSLGQWDGGSLFVIRFDRKAGSTFEDRYAYAHGQGMSKSDAWLSADQSIRKECEYWHEVTCGDVSWVGGTVALLADAEDPDDEIDSESCWGFEYPDADGYLLGEMNSWAHSLVRNQLARHGLTAPLTTDGVAAATKAWHTALATSDDDQQFADDVFINVYKEWVNARVHLGRVVPVRARDRRVARDGLQAAG